VQASVLYVVHRPDLKGDDRGSRPGAPENRNRNNKCY
jgi:hypothetical protein